MAAQGGALDSAETSLFELNDKSGTIASWTVKVHGVTWEDYDYVWQGTPKKGAKVVCNLLSSRSDEYCAGTIRMQKNDKEELQRQKQKFADGTVWKLSKVTLAKEKREWIAASAKICIDLRKTQCDPVLQSTVPMPPAPTPSDSLFALTKLPHKQKVDLMAHVKSFSNERRHTTKNGNKDIVDVVIVDGSKPGDNEDQVEAEFAMFFDIDAKGTQLKTMIQQLIATHTPANLFGLMCTPDSAGKVGFSTSKTFSIEEARGTSAKLERLRSQAEQILVSDTSRISTTWEAQGSFHVAREFASEDANLTVCAVLSAMLRPPANSSAAEHAELDELLQINHCHVTTPAPGESLVTQVGERLWFQVQVPDMTGSVSLYMRESAALELADCKSKEEFVSKHASDGLVFPVLASIRVHVKNQKPQGGTDDAKEHVHLNAIVVEAADQDLNEMPNTTLLNMKPLLLNLSLSSDELRAAALADVQTQAHVGMMVDNRGCNLVLALIAAHEKSAWERFGQGYRLTISNVIDVGYGSGALQSSQTDANRQTSNVLVSICNESNLTDYKLGPLRKDGVQYALVIISGMRETTLTSGAQEHAAPGASQSTSGAQEHDSPGASQRKIFMVERVQLIDKDSAEDCRKLVGKLAFARSQITFSGTKRDQNALASANVTPSPSGKKVRRLSHSPTDGSLPDTPEHGAPEHARLDI